MYMYGAERQPPAAAEGPHMVVAVDFGMTCTGVAYTNLSIGSETVRWIQKWPGRGQANENKCPTVLVYPHQSPTPSSWGFQSETISEQTAEDREYREWFKTYLDPARLQQAQAEFPQETPGSVQEVEKWFEDYMCHLYQHIEFVLSYELAGVYWPNAYIEFIFSVPTTWDNPTVERFRAIIHRAGFARHVRHVVSIGLTEAEAAAVHTSTEAPGVFRDQDILLVCDAGGGTTDLSVLRVVANQSHWMSLQQLDVVFGE
ncbi:putative hsp70 family protein [Neofusicoccum parvum UCRNP2]|uniref:Putative hsp70 family protein n=1 Tax=Botryosphaeria parva (strain UCR-NP2) TaxID=1287680 RepID=R1GMV7_BOTPV|nr:putative hsp70 family protein [Neofusicoccum parvum UCRNP2]